MKHLRRWIIIVFCVWHMFAVFVYVIPDETKHPLWQNIEDATLPYIRPYMYATSQWQKWNIFSPNPIRRVSTYIIEINEDGRWQPIMTFVPTELPWWKRSRELKVLRRAEELGENGAIAYLQFLCRSGDIPYGAQIRFSYSYYVIPMIGDVRKAGGWRYFVPQRNTHNLAASTCKRT